MLRTLRPWSAFFVLGILFLSGCTINRDIMFKTPTDYQFQTYSDTSSKNLILQQNDVLQFKLFANDGFKMIDLVTEGGSREAGIINRTIFTYTIDGDGKAKLPLLEKVPLKGLRLREAEAMLEEKYSEYYRRPFVQLMVLNRRVVVFPGGGGDARVITLENNNTTLLEVLAMAGGLAKRGDARKIKVFRHLPDGKRTVHMFDMSDIDGLKDADIVMQGDDIVYVQPNPELAREALQDL
ncbi:MAG TPA: polysaccharide biosynthesis/export family protein, partial [Flavobacteriales bacterium]|nr:polysaccharide biosynthesis/export family protein [Flavobacteriales bacterium]